ncbi:MAG: cation-translocating P-type ATPase [Eggerthellaceae bacterium]|nr:cation-translocating P-type ATPase [Eggerthellaceae bacterium]
MTDGTNTTEACECRVGTVEALAGAPTAAPSACTCDEEANAANTDSCAGGCSCSCEGGFEDEEGMAPFEKVALVVSGAFVACGLIAEHAFVSRLFMLLFSSIALLAGLVILLPKTFSSLKSRSIDINVLLVVAVVGAVYVQAFEEAAAVLFLYSIGELLEGRALRKSTDAIKELEKLAPDTALVVREGVVVEVRTDQVAIGETITVRPGMSVALDGVIVGGASSFNDAAITGESTLVRKGVSDVVFAGSLALDGACFIETTSTVADSTLAKIASMVEDARKQKSTQEQLVQRFAKVYTPLVIVAAVLVAAVPPVLSYSGVAALGGVDTWIYRACELLVISCPCAFVISTPVTFVSALARAARLGMLVKGGAFFEAGASVMVAAFDKTGTLTQGRPVVVKAVLNRANIPETGAQQCAQADLARCVASAAACTPEQPKPHAFEEGTPAFTRMLEVAYALEVHSAHPLAQAVTSFAGRHGTHAQDRVSSPVLPEGACGAQSLDNAPSITETAGKGVVGQVGAERFAIGSQAFLEEDLHMGEELAAMAEETSNEEGTLLYVACLDPEPFLLGAFVVADAVRESSAEAVSALKRVRKGVLTVMLTGDNPRVAASVAQAVGIEEVHAALLPQEKAFEVQRLQSAFGATAFVGDGINDAPSLACADVGVAMGGAGNAAALTSADVVLMADDLAALPKFFSLAERTVAVLRQNIVGAIGFKVLVALLVIAGIAQMWMAVLADTGVALLVILNGMRLLRTRL